MEDVDKIPVQYQLPKKLVVRLKQRAAEEGRRYSDLCEDAIRDYLDRAASLEPTAAAC